MMESPANAGKNRDFVLVAKNTLAALMIKKHDVIGLCLNVIDHHFRAPFPEGLDDLGCLRPGPPAAAPRTPPPAPPPCPPTDQDWLSVMNTRGFSVSGTAFWPCCAGAEHKKQSKVSNTHTGIFIEPSRTPRVLYLTDWTVFPTRRSDASCSRHSPSAFFPSL